MSDEQDDDDGNGRGEVFEDRGGDVTVESKPWNPKEKRSGVLAMKVLATKVDSDSLGDPVNSTAFQSWRLNVAVTSV